jgi:allophanate hydrolase subunit 2
MTIKVLHPGLSTSVQDLGRPGYFHLGIPIGGAMDRYAMRAANLWRSPAGPLSRSGRARC